MSRKDAASRVNQWVNWGTNGKITSILDQTDPFDEGSTRERPFTRADGTTKNHPLMAAGGHFRYLEGDGFQAMSLPYGNERISLYVFLPSKDSSLDAFSKALTPELWADPMGRFENCTGSVVLPRVKLEYDADLIPALKALGMAPAFGQGADFTGLFTGNVDDVYISGVRHKTCLDINERGTEAAAVTAVKATGATLFLGAITDP